jgi:hypothetical protein
VQQTHTKVCCVQLFRRAGQFFDGLGLLFLPHQEHHSEPAGVRLLLEQTRSGQVKLFLYWHQAGRLL